MLRERENTMSKFTQVSASRPCPICNGTSKCAFTDNAVICHRVPSDCPRPDHFNPSKTVWLHRLAAEGLKDLRDWYRADPDAARQALASEPGGSAALF